MDRPIIAVVSNDAVAFLSERERRTRLAFGRWCFEEVVFIIVGCTSVCKHNSLCLCLCGSALHWTVCSSVKSRQFHHGDIFSRLPYIMSGCGTVCCEVTEPLCFITVPIHHVVRCLGEFQQVCALLWRFGACNQELIVTSCESCCVGPSHRICLTATAAFLNIEIYIPT